MHFNLIRNKVLVMAIACLLSACSVFYPVKTEQTTSYVLNTLPSSVTKKPTHKITLLVAQPATSQIYNTTQMAYTTQPYQVAYFVKSRWADTPSQMLQSLLTEALQNTHYFYAVGVSPVLSQYDYVLNMQLLQFEQRFSGHMSEILITLRAQISKTANGQVVAAKQFTIVEPTLANTPYAGVVAANKGTAKLLAQVTKFCLQEMDGL